MCIGLTDVAYQSLRYGLRAGAIPVVFGGKPSVEFVLTVPKPSRASSCCAVRFTPSLCASLTVSFQNLNGRGAWHGMARRHDVSEWRERTPGRAQIVCVLAIQIIFDSQAMARRRRTPVDVLLRLGISRGQEGGVSTNTSCASVLSTAPRHTPTPLLCAPPFSDPNDSQAAGHMPLNQPSHPMAPPH